ncbi:TMV resistance protein N-like protein [Tanacetum coccineum]
MEQRLQDLEPSLDIALNDGSLKSVIERVVVITKKGNDQINDISSVHARKNMMKKKLGGKILLVLDDVDHIDQLEALASESNWFSPGSRIIITTREEQVLIAHRVKWIHDVSLLTDVEAIHLFHRHAFGRDISNQEYEMLSLKVVNYAAGLPLTIKVLGSFLCGKDKPVWIEALERLETIPLKETLEKLELSYMGLEDDYKEIFLDVACFLKGSRKDVTIRVLESCGFHAKNGLRVLELKSLIRITKDDLFNKEVIQMHDHLEEMGKNIVRRFQTDEPHRHTRLWIQEEIEDILANDLGTEATRCVDMKITPEIVLKGLGKMNNLRCLRVNNRSYDSCFRDNDHLRELDNLVGLVLESSEMIQLWEGGERKVLNKLKFLDLCCPKLRSLDLRLTPNLKSLVIAGCHDLAQIYVHHGCVHSLFCLGFYQRLSLSLESFSFIKQSISLEVLCLYGLDLREFPDIIPRQLNESLRELNFAGNDIEKLPSSFGNLHKLVDLNLTGCTKLKKLPRSFCRLRLLRNLSLQNCHQLELPEDLGHLESLEKLDLTLTNISYIPSSICNLKYLKVLLLYGCERLKELPEKLGDLHSLQVLNVKLTPLTHLPHGIWLLEGLEIIGYVSNEQILEDSIMYPDALYPSMFQSSF